LSSSEVKAEEALGEHGEEDEPAGEDRLHDRQRRERERAAVQTPGDDRHDPAEQEPPRAKETGGAAQRMADPDRRGEHRAAVFEQEGEVRANCRSEREGSVRGSREVARLDTVLVDGEPPVCRAVGDPPKFKVAAVGIEGPCFRFAWMRTRAARDRGQPTVPQPTMKAGMTANVPPALQWTTRRRAR
jgi:hypothetical protein